MLRPNPNRTVGRFFPGLASLAITIVISLLPLSTGQGKTTEFELFYPNPVPEGTFMTESPRIFGRLWILGTYLQLEKNPVTLADEFGSQYLGQTVYYRAQVRGILSINLWQLGQVSLDLPLTLLAGQKINGRKDPYQTYLNDQGLKFRVPLLHRGSFYLGASAFLNFGTGSTNNFGGTQGRFSQPGGALLGEYELGKLFFRANLGYEEKAHTVLPEYNLIIDDRVFYRLAVGRKWIWQTTFFTEYIGSTQIDKFLTDVQHDAQELYLGGQKRWGDFVLGPALDLGLSKAFGVPAWRLVFSLFYLPERKPEPPPLVVEKPKEPPRGRITLAVVDEKSRRPVGGSRVAWRKEGATRDTTTSPFGIVLVEESAGEIPLRIEKEGYYPGNVTVTLTPGVEREIQVDLRPVPAAPEEVPRLPRLDVEIVDAQTKEPVKSGTVYIQNQNLEDAFIDGKWHLITPPGDHRIIFSAEGYYPDTEKVTFSPDQDQTLKVELAQISKEKVVVTKRQIFILEKISFDTASSKIKPTSYSILDRVVDVLAEHTEIKKIFIKGHTDTRGKHDYNIRLSENRAKSVRLYLIKKGIEAQRLESKGFGPDQPIADNTTPVGWEKNRRVEFEILERIGTE